MLRHLFLLAAFAAAMPAALLRVEIAERRDVLGGQTFGTGGSYELLRGRAYFAVDPKSSANSHITDISLAARNEQGMLTFSADVVVIRPKNPAAGNRTVIVETPNRGGMGMLAMYNRARGSADPSLPEHFGDGYLLREGYTLAWVGWQHDVPLREGLLRAYVPEARGVSGWVRGEVTPSAPLTRFSLGDSGHVPYKISDPASLTLTVRDGVHGKRTPLRPDEWSLQGTEIVLTQPANPGRIYEFLYRSEDPAITGLGLAAVRDFVAALKFGGGELGGRVKFALGVGTSQSAMALRSLVYEGFNTDEQGRKVFDGLQPHVAGGRRATFERFAQPSRTSGPYRNASHSTTDQFPYSDAVDTELATGRKDSLLARAGAAVPKIIYTNSSYEYWGSASALLHTSLDGKRDLQLPETTRIYLLAGGQHGPAAFPPQPGAGRNLANWNDYKWTLRAVLRNLRQWVAEGVAPPPSRYPRLADGTLGKAAPPPYRTQYLDFGPEYLSKGIIANQPPKPGAEYTVLTPQPDADGIDRAGVKSPWVAVPLGTFTGWNLRTAAIGAEGELLGQTGSFIPFATDTIRKRFAGRDVYVQQIEAAARQLVRDRFLLADDVPQVVSFGGRSWDWVMGASNMTRAARIE